MVLNYELVRIGIALAGTGLAAFEDARTSFIDDRLTVSMIAAGTLLNLLTLDWNFIYPAAGTTLAIFAIGYVFYRSGQLGGGDVLLLCGIQSLLPAYPFAAMSTAFSFLGIAAPPTASSVSFLVLPFFLSVYLASSFLGMAFSGYIYAAKLFLKTKMRGLRPDVMLGGPAAAFCAFLLYWSGTALGLPAHKVFIEALFLLPSALLITFKKDITEKVALRYLPVGQMEDEDVIYLEKIPKPLVEKYGICRVLTDDMKKVLKKVEEDEDFRRFPVQKDLPRFGPYILLGLLASLYFADPLAAFLFF